MPRQDLYFDVVCGEINITDNLTNKYLCPFSLLDSVLERDNDNYCYGEIMLATGMNESYALESGIRFKVPYLPYYKKLIVRICKESGNGASEYILNRTDNTIWFAVCIRESEERCRAAFCSELFSINEKGNYNLILHDGVFTIYSANETDFQMRAALKQNEIFLLKSFAGSLYQYPTTGVGLIDFLHGNLESSGLGRKLKEEFESDQMVINNAYMDSTLGELVLDVVEKNG